MSEVRADIDASIAFLEQWRPGGPWWLTAIIPDGATDTRTFSPDSVAKLRAFLATVEGTKNVYFMVNPARRALDKKATKEDVAALEWLHVDADPDKKLDLGRAEVMAAERARIRGLFDGAVPPPTVLIDSGGGFQGFWKLREPVPLQGGMDQIEELELYNRALSAAYGGDNCHNIDRIMRLPGTINVPGKTKRRAGRTTMTLARLVSFSDSLYGLGSFKKAAGSIVRRAAANDWVDTVELGALASVDVETLDLKERYKTIISLGDDPDKPFRSRSEAVYAVLCECVRAGLTNEQIAAVVLDAGNGISASVLDKRSPQREAARQIAKARLAVNNPELVELNEAHAVVFESGKTRVITEAVDPVLHRKVLPRSSFDDLRNLYCNRQMQAGVDQKGNPKYVPLGQWWIGHPRRRQYTQIVFSPGASVPGAYNLWQGFTVDPAPGDWGLYRAHMLDVICSGDQECFDYLFRWMARCAQAPDQQGMVAVVLRGPEGAGKGAFVQEFGALVGQHFVHVSSAQHITGHFNAHLEDCVILYVDEALWAGDKSGEATLKRLVTERFNVIERKGVDAVMRPNYTHIIFSSNEEWVVPAGDRARRFFVLDVGGARAKDKVYFKKMFKQMHEDGGRAALLHDLLAVDLTGFEVTDFPRTAALREQAVRSYKGVKGWWYDKLMAGVILESQKAWKSPVRTSEMFEDFYEWAKRVGGSHRATETEVGMFFTKHLPGEGVRKRRWIGDVRGRDGVIVRQRVYYYEFPGLTECRDRFNEVTGHAHPWGDVVPVEVGEGGAAVGPGGAAAGEEDHFTGPR